MSDCAFRLTRDSYREHLSHDVPFSVIETEDSGQYTCHRESTADSRYCPLHQPVDEKDPTEAIALIQEGLCKAAARDRPRDLPDFTGVKLDSLDLSNLDLPAQSLENVTVEFRYAHITGEVVLQSNLYRGLFDFSHASLGAFTCESHGEDQGNLKLSGAVIGAPDAYAGMSPTTRAVSGDIADQDLKAYIDVEQGKQISADGLTIRGEGVLKGNVTKAVISRVECEQRFECSLDCDVLQAERLMMHESLQLNGLTVAEKADFSQTHVDGKTSVDITGTGEIIGTNVTFGDAATFTFRQKVDTVRLNQSDFQQVTVDFVGATHIKMEDITIADELLFKDIGGCETLSLADADIGCLTIEKCNHLDKLDLSEISIGGSLTVHRRSVTIGVLDAHGLVVGETFDINHGTGDDIPEDDTKIYERFSVSEADIGTLRTEGAKLGGSVNWTEADIGCIRSAESAFGGLSPSQATWDISYSEDHVDQQHSGADDDQPPLQFTGLRVHETASFRAATFTATAGFCQARFSDSARFDNATFKKAVDFQQVRFEDRAIFTINVETVQNGTDDSESTGPSAEVAALFEAGVEFDEAVFESGPEFQWQRGSASVSPTNYNATTVGGAASFVGASLAKANLKQFCAETVNFEDADLTDANCTGADFTGGNFRTAILSRANLTAATFEGAILDGTVFSDAQIDDTTSFDGLRFSSGIASSILCRYDPTASDSLIPSDPLSASDTTDPSVATKTYRKLENLMTENGLTDAGRRYYIRRRQVNNGERSLSKRLPYAMLNRATGYGEGPHCVVVASGLVMLLFGLLYAGLIASGLGTLEGAAVGVLDHLYYSGLVFTTLGQGPYNATGIVKWVSVLETGLGSIAIALFVFTLGQRVAR